MVKVVVPHVPLTRFDVENTYYVSSGIIRSFGQFHEEAVYVPFFWDLSLNRKHTFVYRDNHGESWLFTTITPNMIVEFPELFGLREVGVCRQRGQVVSWVRTVHCPPLA